MFLLCSQRASAAMWSQTVMSVWHMSWFIFKSAVVLKSVFRCMHWSFAELESAHFPIAGNIYFWGTVYYAPERERERKNICWNQFCCPPFPPHIFNPMPADRLCYICLSDKAWKTQMFDVLTCLVFTPSKLFCLFLNWWTS